MKVLYGEVEEERGRGLSRRVEVESETKVRVKECVRSTSNKEDRDGLSGVTRSTIGAGNQNPECKEASGGCGASTLA